MNKIEIESPQSDLCKLVSIILGFTLAFFICAILGGCKTRQSVISERVIYDTVWTTKVVHDSINGTRVEREITKIVPHIIRVGDTTIIYSDTIINRSTDNNTYLTKYVYQVQGKISKDSARIEEKKVMPTQKVKAKDKKDSKWRSFWTGVILGVLVTLCIRYHKNIAGFIKRLAKRIL